MISLRNIHEQVTDIKTSLNLWLAGKESNIKSRPIAPIFDEGNLIQLYVTDQKAIDTPNGLTPIANYVLQKIFKMPMSG